MALDSWQTSITYFEAVAVAQWSASFSSTLTTRVRIPLAIEFCSTVLRKDKAEIGPFKKHQNLSIVILMLLQQDYCIVPQPSRTILLLQITVAIVQRLHVRGFSNKIADQSLQRKSYQQKMKSNLQKSFFLFILHDLVVAAVIELHLEDNPSGTLENPQLRGPLEAN